MSKALETVGEIQLYISALTELTQQLVDLSGSPDKYDLFNAIDCARVATQEKLTALVNGLENYLRCGGGVGTV